MEEDTGKLIHEGGSSLIDFNRSGVPLVEIVTEPDFSEAGEVKEYLQKLQQIVRDLDVSNADMEKGDMRLEPNISLRHSGTNDLPKYKVEVKNINSFSFVEKAINYEIKRQTEILDSGKTPTQETRGWNEDKGITFSQRVKEEANDYRYFPEPDIPPITLADQQISTLKSQQPELREEKIRRFATQYQLSEYNAEILTREKAMADYFEKAAKAGIQLHLTPTQIANPTINERIVPFSISPEKWVSEIASSAQTVQIGEEELNKIIEKVLSENPKAVEDFKKGKESVIMYLVGQVMRSLGKKVDVRLVKDKLASSLKK